MKIQSKYLYAFYMAVGFFAFIMSIIVCSFGSKASTTSGDIPENYFGYTIYDSDSLNAQAIQAFNNMSDEERMSYCKSIYPIFAKKLGFINTDPYTFCSDEWQEKIVLLKNAYQTADALYEDRENVPHWQLYIVYSRGHGWRWYENFSEYLANVITVQDNQLVMNQTSNIYYLIDDAIQAEQEENGVINVHIKSYMNINSSNFGNLSQYSDFIRLCREHRDKGYVVIAHSIGSENNIVIGFPQIKPNLYNNGVTVLNTLNFCNDDGVGYYNFNWYMTTRWNGNADTYFSHDNDYVYGHNFCVGGATIPSLNVNSWSNNFRPDGIALYTLNDEEVDLQLFTSLTGWINHHGHYEPSYELTGIYGTVPSATVNSNNVTTYYNNTYTDNSTHNYVYYPPNYDPSQNSYDTDTHTLKFDGIGSFLASLGELIGSLINGIAQGLANIISSLISIVNNLKQNLIDGVIFEFLSTFIGWLPSEIIALLTALFAITVIFALIKLLKGFF